MSTALKGCEVIYKPCILKLINDSEARYNYVSFRKCIIKFSIQVTHTLLQSVIHSLTRLYHTLLHPVIHFITRLFHTCIFTTGYTFHNTTISMLW